MSLNKQSKEYNVSKTITTTLVSTVFAATLCLHQSSDASNSPPKSDSTLTKSEITITNHDKEDKSVIASKSSGKEKKPDINTKSRDKEDTSGATAKNKRAVDKLDGQSAKNAVRDKNTTNNTNPGDGESDLAVSVPIKQAQTRAFGLRLLDQVVQERKNENVLISPYSAHVVLSMTMSGAMGKTREEMAKVLELSAVPASQSDANAQSMIRSVTSDHGAPTLLVANAAFIDKELDVVAAFVDRCKKFYSADIRNVALADPSTLESINKWCADNTNNKINKILDSLSKDDIMVLLNAIYFKGNWDQKFEKGDTLEQPFHLLSGGTKNVQMMSRLDDMQYYRGKDFACVSLPYEGRKTAMIVMLPDKGKSPAQLIPIISAKFPQSFEKQSVNLQMPRFKIECTTRMNDALKKLGMVQAMSSSNADFSGMVSAKIKAYISQVLQKTYMDVNEEGTEAAAVTAVTMTRALASATPVKPISFTVDRPFMVALVHTPTNELLFLGVINDPK